MPRIFRAFELALNWFTTFFISLLFIRLFELYWLGQHHTYPDGTFLYFTLGIIYSLGFALANTTLIALLYFAINKPSPVVRWISHGWALLLILIESGLTIYYGQMEILLGADLFGYSWKDINETIGTSADFSIMSVLPFIVVPALYFIAAKRIHISVSAKIIAPLSLISFILFAFTDPSSFIHNPKSRALACDKAVFIIHDFGRSIKENSVQIAGLDEFPLEEEDNYPDVLGSRFEKFRGTPDIIFIVVESLGAEFTTNDARYGGCMPFLDSLSKQSLYWSHAISATGRTFGVMPSLLGSLPFSDNGFMSIAPNFPNFITLPKILKANGYKTEFIHGSNLHFDNLDMFMDAQDFDVQWGEDNMPQDAPRATPNESGYSWGYDDHILFKEYFRLRKTQEKYPRFDLFLTLTNHEPFLPPNLEYHQQWVKEKSAGFNEKMKEKVNKNLNIFATLHYTDESLRRFFAQLKQLPEYENTIVVITGDHRLIPIPMDDQLCRFHVPLIIASPKLKKPEQFDQLAGHLDVAPTFNAFFKHTLLLHTPEKVSWLGNGLPVNDDDAASRKYVMMRNKHALRDIIIGDKYFADGELFKINDDFSLSSLKDAELLAQLEGELNRFRGINNLVTDLSKGQHLSSDTVFSKSLTNNAIEEFDRDLYHLLADTLSGDDQFFKARTLAFDHQYDSARTLCRGILHTSPNYHDVRTLLGRTYAWDKKYEEAEIQFRECIRRNPGYDDAWFALIEMKLWDSKYQEAVDLAKEAQVKTTKLALFAYEEAKALDRMGDKKAAMEAVKKSLKAEPNFKESLKLRDSL